MKTGHIVIGAVVLLAAAFLLRPSPVVTNHPSQLAVAATTAQPTPVDATEVAPKALPTNSTVTTLPDGSAVIHERAHFALAPVGNRPSTKATMTEPPTNTVWRQISRHVPTNAAGTGNR